MKHSPTERFLLDLYNFFLTVVHEDLSRQHSHLRIFKMIFPIDPKPVYNRHKKRLGDKKFKIITKILERSGYINFPRGSNGKLTITVKGWRRLLKLGPERLGFRKLSNNKSIMVIFDIPENRKNIRNAFRRDLKLLGYEQLQKSVWLSSYDVLRETEELIDIYGLGGEAGVGEIEGFDFRKK